jgi:hypothetical protein
MTDFGWCVEGYTAELDRYGLKGNVRRNRDMTR